MTNLRSCGRVLLVTSLVALGVGCGERRSETEKRQAREQAAFCEKLTKAVASGDEAELKAALANPPLELAEAAKTIRDPGGSSGKFAEASAEIFGFAQEVCRPEGERKLAPPAGTRIEGLTLCGGTTFPVAPASDEGAGAVIYGDTSASDPYNGPMLGLFWDPAGADSHQGVGESRAVTVHGREGVAAPITVFNRIVLPELGTVIAWSEGGRDYGLYGRLWSLDQVDQLVEIANGMEVIDQRPQLPATLLPAGFGQVYDGPQSAVDLVRTLSLYAVRYRTENNLLTVSGMGMSAETFNAARFLSGLEQTDAGGRPGLAGYAWTEEGPVIVTWREPDGLVVRIVGLGTRLELVQLLAASTRELSDDEWNAVTTSAGACGT